MSISYPTKIRISGYGGQADSLRRGEIIMNHHIYANCQDVCAFCRPKIGLTFYVCTVIFNTDDSLIDLLGIICNYSMILKVTALNGRNFSGMGYAAKYRDLNRDTFNGKKIPCENNAHTNANIIFFPITRFDCWNLNMHIINGF